MKKPLENIEIERLNDVYLKLCQYVRKDKEKDSFGYEELVALLTDLKYPWTKHEV